MTFAALLFTCRPERRRCTGLWRVHDAVRWVGEGAELTHASRLRRAPEQCSFPSLRARSVLRGRNNPDLGAWKLRANTRRESGPADRPRNNVQPGQHQCVSDVMWVKGAAAAAAGHARTHRSPSSSQISQQRRACPALTCGLCRRADTSFSCSTQQHVSHMT